jgi:hypothetical protein
MLQLAWRMTAALVLLLDGFLRPTLACCPAGPPNKPVLNADQSVVLVWDAERGVEHFLRKATFQSEGDDFGFIIPSPTAPELGEADDQVFAALTEVTKPEVKRVPRAPNIACSAPPSATTAGAVRVLQRAVVAGYDAAVLAADSSTALVEWLRQNGYESSEAIAAWAKPYVEQSWTFTALKIAAGAREAKTNVAAPALRLSFQTKAPLFPYREPDSREAVDLLKPSRRLLRIFFLSNARYRGELTGGTWTGQTAWAGRLSTAVATQLLEKLKLPTSLGGQLWLTEFEDLWPYAKAPSDLAFSMDADQSDIRREPHIEYYEDFTGTFLCLGCFLVIVGIPVWLVLRALLNLTKRSTSVAA